jgi:hypothetical protein
MRHGTGAVQAMQLRHRFGQNMGAQVRRLSNPPLLLPMRPKYCVLACDRAVALQQNAIR